MALQPRTPLEVSASMVKTGVRFAAWTERQAMALVRSRLFPDGEPPALPSAEPETIEQRMRQLLDRALEQSASDSRLALFDKLVNDLVPDEARILGALSDGSRSPLVNIRVRHVSGAAGELVVSNASLVGRTANLTSPQLTPTYVAHLLSLGLVEIGPQAQDLSDDYQILVADTVILKALKTAARGPVAPRVERLTLLLSPLGRELWAACNPQGGLRS
jgi:hypothetical protein